MSTKANTENAVSPVIGVLLMVSITIILAAVIAAFIFGMANQMPQNNIVGVTVVKNSATQATVTNIGGQGVNALTNPINISVDDGTAITYYDLGKAVAASEKVVLTSGVQNRIMAVGEFGPNTKQILLDVYI